MANLWLYAAAAIVVLIPTGIAELILLFTDRLLAEVIVWTIASVVSMPLWQFSRFSSSRTTTGSHRAPGSLVSDAATQK